MTSRLALPTGVAGLGALVTAAVVLGGAGTIQNDLTRRTRVALAEAGITADVSLSGRDATVVVDAPLPAAVLARLEGPGTDLRSLRVVVRSPSTTPPLATTAAPTTAAPATTPAPTPTTIAPASTAPETTAPATTAPETTAPETTAPATTAPATTAEPAVSVRASLGQDGTVTLDGTVFSIIEQAALVVGAERAVGAGNVIDRLVIVEGDPLVGDPLVAALVRVVRLFGNGLAPASATLSDGTVQVVGALADEAAATALGRAADIAAGQGVGFDTSTVVRAG